MEPPQSQEPAARQGRGRGLRSGLLAAGAALGMTLAGLGVAGAQIDGSTTQPSTNRPSTSAPSARGGEPGPDEMPGRGHGARHGHRHHMGPRLSVAAEAIGIPAAELRQAVRSGQSIAQVAEAKNVEVQKVIDALVAAAKAHLAEKVEAGDLTQAQADQRASTLTTRVTEMVNRTHC